MKSWFRSTDGCKTFSRIGALAIALAITASQAAQSDMERLKERLACLPKDKQEVFAARFKSTIVEPMLEKSKQLALELKAERDRAVKASNDCLANARREEKPPRESCATQIDAAQQYDKGTAPSMQKDAIERWFARELPDMPARTKALLDELPPC